VDKPRALCIKHPVNAIYVEPAAQLPQGLRLA
jgi:hypothetical protein